MMANRTRDRAIGKQSFSTAQRYRIYLQPERIDQIMLDERLNEILRFHKRANPTLPAT
jgi:hypothetical protein